MTLFNTKEEKNLCILYIYVHIMKVNGSNVVLNYFNFHFTDKNG